MNKMNKNTGAPGPTIFGRIPPWRDSLKKKLFSVILMQSFIGIFVGVAVAYTVERDRVPGQTRVAAVEIGGLTAGETEKRLKDQADTWVKEGTLKISVDGAAACEIGYRDMGMAVKLDETMERVLGKVKPGDALANFISGELARQERRLEPVFSVDLQRLKEQLTRLSPVMERDPVNASVSLAYGKVTKVPETAGRKLNVDKAADTVIKQLFIGMTEPVEFHTASGLELEPLQPEFALNDLEGADDVVASYATGIETDESMEDIRLAVKAINQSIVSCNTGSDRDIFSFIAKLEKLDALLETDNQGYDQVASTLYAAALAAGIDKNSIIRTPHGTTADYIEPGLDARVSGDTADLQIKNTTGSPLVILAEILDGKVQINLVGKASGRQSELKVEVKARIQPPVIKLPNDRLSPGMEREISPGREGMEVQVTRIRTGDGGETKTETIGSDSYRPVEAIVEFGPDYSGDVRSQK